MDIRKIINKLRIFSKERDWDKFHTLKNLACSINIESSELLEIFQWNELSKSEIKKKEIKKRISDEVADIMLYLIKFADIAKIDIENSCLEKIEKNKKKYPISLSKGVSTKYNKLGG